MQLADEPFWATWAHLRWPALAHSTPMPSAPVIGRVPAVTLVGSREIVLALERHVDEFGDDWIHARLPLRPNGSTGWLRSRDLGKLRRVRRALVIEAASLRAALLKDGEELWEAPVSLGKPGFDTPRGDFYVRFRLVPRRSTPYYGSFSFWTNAFMPEDWAPDCGWVGIHGTNRPDLLSSHVSAGCVRLRNEDVLKLRDLLPVGAPVSIR